MLSDFRAFLQKQNVVGLAIAVVVGGALGTVVKSVVDDLIMPLVLPFTFGGEWQKWTLNLGPVHLGIGHFIGAMINFLIIGAVAWQLSRYLVKKDAPTIKCPFCVSAIDATARRCPHCTSEIPTAA